MSEIGVGEGKVEVELRGMERERGGGDLIDRRKTFEMKWMI